MSIPLIRYDLGHTLRYSYYDENKNPIIGEYGYHNVEYEWSQMGQSTKSTTYGTNYELLPDEFGTAIYACILAPSGMIKTIERYNENEVLANNSNNVAITYYEPRLNGLYYMEKEINAIGGVVNDSIQ